MTSTPYKFSPLPLGGGRSALFSLDGMLLLSSASDKAFNIAFGMVVGGGFALWLILFPRSVIRFNTWLARREIESPSPTAIRLIGFGWLLLVSCVMFFG